MNHSTNSISSQSVASYDVHTDNINQTEANSQSMSTNIDAANVAVAVENSSEHSFASNNGDAQTVDDKSATNIAPIIDTMHAPNSEYTQSEHSNDDAVEPASMSPNDSPNEHVNMNEHEHKKVSDIGLLQQQIESLEEEPKRKALTDKLYAIIEPIQPLLVAKITGMIVHQQSNEKILEYLLDPERRALHKQIDQASDLLTGSSVTGGEYYHLYHDLSRCNNSTEKLTYLRSKLYPKVEEYVYRKSLAELITEMLLDKLDTPQLIVILDPDERIALKSRMDQAIAAYVLYHQQLAQQKEMQKQQQIQQEQQLQRQQQQQREQQQKLQHHHQQQQLKQFQLQQQILLQQKMNQQRMQQQMHRQINPRILQQQQLALQQKLIQQQQQHAVYQNGVHHGGAYRFGNGIRYNMQTPQYNTRVYQNALHHQQ